MSDVGGVLVDKDAVYIDVGDKESFNANNEDGEIKGEGETMVTNLQDVAKTMAERFEEGPGLQLFSNSSALRNEVSHGSDESEEEHGLLSDVDDDDNEETIVDTGRTSMRKARVYGKSVSEDDEFDDVESDEEGEDDFEDDEREPRLVEVEFDANKYNDKELEYVEDSALSSDEDDSSYKAAASRLKGSSKRKWDINKLIYMTNIDPADAIKRWMGEVDDDDEEEEDIEQDDGDFSRRRM